MRVVIVDDSPIVTKMIEAHLSRLGYEVHAFNSPFGISNKVRELKPQVVLMDLGMPGLSGDKLLGFFKGHGNEFRVIVVSSAEENELKDLVTKGLAHDYYVKGKPLDTLVEKIIYQVNTLSA